MMHRVLLWFTVLYVVYAAPKQHHKGKSQHKETVESGFIGDNSELEEAVEDISLIGDLPLGLNPCDLERKEKGSHAFCWHCHDAATEEECQASGEYMRCPSPNDICYKYTQTHGSNDGLRKDTVKFDRGCKPIFSCENAALGPKNWACSPARNDHSMTNCLQCDYDDYKCSPPNTCPSDHKGKAGKLWCLRCKNAESDEACAETGTYEECPTDKHLCYRFEQRSGTTGRTAIDKGCLPVTACDNAALGPYDQACHPSKNDPSTTVCRTCGTDEGTCAPPTPPPSDMATCSCRGDPHCHQFDQTADSPPLDIKGSCIYTLATDSCLLHGRQRRQSVFEILANFHKSEIGRPLTYVDQVIINIKAKRGPATNIVLGHEGVVNYNSAPVTLPFEPKELRGLSIIMDSEGNTVVSLPNGVEVVWNNHKMVDIKAPQNMMGNMCGICGQYSGVEDHLDRTMGPFKLARTCPALGHGTPGKQASTDQMFANSWLAALDGLDANCAKDCAHGIQ